MTDLRATRSLPKDKRIQILRKLTRGLSANDNPLYDFNLKAAPSARRPLLTL